MQRLTFIVFGFSALLLALTTTPTQLAQAQTFTVLHNFTGGTDGAVPIAGLSMDRTGNLYGTTIGGGIQGTHCGSFGGCGTVFVLSNKGSGWILTPLYVFQGGNDGSNPMARVIIGPDGSLYGTTIAGGQGQGCLFNGSTGCGTVFNLRPPTHACGRAVCSWTETILYNFLGSSADGANPYSGDLLFDHAGDLYGTTLEGGTVNAGTVFELTPHNGTWTENFHYSFYVSSALMAPTSGVVFDSSGNLYGTTESGGSCDGVGGGVYELTPSSHGWTETDLHLFNCVSDGGQPIGGLISDNSGGFYGTTSINGAGVGGTVYVLSPSNGTWTFSVAYSFNGDGGYGPYDSLTMDTTGNLYGTTYQDGANRFGAVFKLTPSGSGWTYTSLHDFTGGSDGGYPEGNVILDGNGNLYGTTTFGGAHGFGVVFQITP